MQGFIFDMDGVIIDSEPIHSRVKLDTLQHFGLSFVPADLEKYMGRTSRAMFTDVIREQQRQDLDVEMVTAYKHQHYLDILAHGDDIGPVAGAVELIRSLHGAGVPLGLATSSNRKVIAIVIERFGLADCFQSVISGNELPASKPDPDIYLRTAKNLGLAPADCVVLEDTYNGVLAAKRAGMRCIGYRNPNSGQQDLRQADKIVDSLRELTLDVIRQM
ncbi:MAG TPA: glycoprotease [Selenomonas sp.]|jgi:HAD superfamily hydrolase (TIGR01509 family)|nr:HAD family hydrolase [Selenomonadaceae bacterium]MDD6119609.1 HAD family hydrolase [Selenomonadaceae bacterium]MDY3916708.1 HAD family hydrolase [Selenomonadaceae bacterium]HBT79715.1 glycoprotease [Selenomonas sp.]